MRNRSDTNFNRGNAIMNVMCVCVLQNGNKGHRAIMFAKMTFLNTS